MSKRKVVTTVEGVVSYDEVHRCVLPRASEYESHNNVRFTCGRCGSTWELEYSCDPRPGEGGCYWKKKS